ncbi:MAG TPA: phosphoglucosamine mutase [Phycisphaerales bacterium]|nr:phosphoglucosamine mutase [Phycisphaerales bacterium]
MHDAPLMLSVSGARGIVGRTMTPAVAADYAAAFGSFIRESTGQPSPVMCVGRDSRPSGEMLAAAAVAGLVSVGCKVVEIGVVATPTVAVMIGEYRASGGMAITASHNPIEWNGLKSLNADGVAPPPRDVEKILARFRAKDVVFAPVERLQPIVRDGTANDKHIERVLAIVDVELIRRARLRVVLDSVNGGGCVSGRMLLERLGCEVVHLNGEPTGHFAHTPEPTKENLVDLSRVMAEASRTGRQAACGFAQDPDADRLAIVDENGRYIGEEYTLALAARRVLQRDTSTDQHVNMSKGGADEIVLAANLSTSRMIDDVAAKFGGSGARVLRTAVGEANVVEAMKPSGAIIGGEGNGGVILPGVCWVRDSLAAMALVLELLAAERKPLSAIVDEMPRYAMVKHKMDLSAIGGREAVEPALARVKQAFAGKRINDADGVRIDVDAGWVHLRPSNTEPIIRLIAEAKSDAEAWSLARSVADASGLAI